MPVKIQFTEGTEAEPKSLGFEYANYGDRFEAFDPAHPEKGVVSVPIKNTSLAAIEAAKQTLMETMCADLTTEEKLTRVSVK